MHSCSFTQKLDIQNLYIYKDMRKVVKLDMYVQYNDNQGCFI